jgi:hypothetical protein
MRLPAKRAFGEAHDRNVASPPSAKILKAQHRARTAASAHKGEREGSWTASGGSRLPQRRRKRNCARAEQTRGRLCDGMTRARVRVLGRQGEAIWRSACISSLWTLIRNASLSAAGGACAYGEGSARRDSAGGRQAGPSHAPDCGAQRGQAGRKAPTSRGRQPVSGRSPHSRAHGEIGIVLGGEAARSDPPPKAAPSSSAACEVSPIRIPTRSVVDVSLSRASEG